MSNRLTLVRDRVENTLERQLKLGSDLERIREILFDGQCHLVSDIAKNLDLPECSVSSQIRHLRKTKFGGYEIKLIRLTKGLSGYQMVGI